MRITIALVLALLATLASADTFRLALDIRQASSLFEASRFSDAERAFDKAYQELDPALANQLDVYLVVTDYLARSISQQGISSRVTTLMKERHSLIEQHYDSNGYLFASSLARLAESHYRDGASDKAIELTRQAITLYENLNPVPEEELTLARSNKAQYQLTGFSHAVLPLDLSDFYTKCELLKDTDNPDEADLLMSGFLEVGVDFIPLGKWEDFFNAIKYPAVVDYADSAERRVYIPAENENLRADICFISIKAGKITSVESVFD